MSRLTQVAYLSRGSRFIAIQERVDILTVDAAGDGVEMTPFHNISKEWYAAQTSKKIRAVWQAKAVRKIHALCLAGRGASQIARQLEKEQILIINASTDYMRKR